MEEMTMTTWSVWRQGTKVRETIVVVACALIDCKGKGCKVEVGGVLIRGG